MPALVVTKEGISVTILPGSSAKPTSKPPDQENVSLPPVLVTKAIGPTVTPVPVEILLIALMLGTGFTVIVKFCAMPEHPPILGITLIVATIGIPVEFSAVNAAIFPVPLAGNPIEG